MPDKVTWTVSVSAPAVRFTTVEPVGPPEFDNNNLRSPFYVIGGAHVEMPVYGIGVLEQ